MHDLGTVMAHRMTYDASGASAQIAACQAITLTTTNAASIPVTGISYGASTEQYGGQPISYVELAAGATAVLPAPACTAPVAVAGNDQTTTIGSSVQLDGSLSHDTHDSLPLTYGWQQTGGTPVALSSRTAGHPAFTAPAQGTVITLTLTVTDTYGQVSAPDPIQITVNDIGPANLVATSSSPTHLGHSTAFTATASGSNVTFTWAFGDGATTTGSHVSHSYAAPRDLYCRRHRHQHGRAHLDQQTGERDQSDPHRQCRCGADGGRPVTGYPGRQRFLRSGRRPAADLRLATDRGHAGDAEQPDGRPPDLHGARPVHGDHLHPDGDR